MPYYDDEMTHRAVDAYFRREKRRGVLDQLIDQPSRSDTFRRKRTITIANSYRVLANYRVVKRNNRECVRSIDS